MDRRKRKGLLEKTASAFALPADIVAGLSCIRLVGREELYVQNHKGILAYGEKEMLISGGKILIRVRGSGLKLCAMTATDLAITGQIAAVELE